MFRLAPTSEQALQAFATASASPTCRLRRRIASLNWSMLVITALVGTRDLGQEVYIALTKADAGRGLVAGFAVAFIAIIADRLIQAGAQRARARLGLEDGHHDAA